MQEVVSRLMGNSSTKDNTFNCIQKIFSEIYGPSHNIIEHINEIVRTIYNKINFHLHTFYGSQYEGILLIKKANKLDDVITLKDLNFLSYYDLLLNYANILKNFLEKIKNNKTTSEYTEEWNEDIITQTKIYRIKFMIDIIISKGKKYDFGIMCPLLIVYIVLHNKMFKQENFPASLNYISEYTKNLNDNKEKKIIGKIISKFKTSESKYTQYRYGS